MKKVLVSIIVLCAGSSLEAMVVMHGVRNTFRNVLRGQSIRMYHHKPTATEQIKALQQEGMRLTGKKQLLISRLKGLKLAQDTLAQNNEWNAHKLITARVSDNIKELSTINQQLDCAMANNL